jgi:hypothetical protein
MAAISATHQRYAVSEGIALGLLMCDCNEVPYDKFRVDLAFERAWRTWPHRDSFSQVSTDIRKGLGGSLVMTRANETKQTWVLYWARERSLIICQRDVDWDPNVPAEVEYALEVIGGDVPLEGWISLAKGFLTNLVPRGRKA